MLEYKLVKLPSEANLAIWENCINSYALEGWKLIQLLEQGPIGSSTSSIRYMILERMKSSDNRYNTRTIEESMHTK